MAEKTNVVDVRKVGFLAIFLVVGFIFMIDKSNVFAADEEQSVSAQPPQANDIAVLQEKVSQLERTVANQSALITQQKLILDKLVTLVPQAKDALAQAEPKTMVRKFVINGSNLFTAKDFEAVLGKYRDKELGMSDLKKAADEITLLYRKKGYITSLAYVPAQEMANETVEFNTVEGRVGDIRVEAPKYDSNVKNINDRFLVEKGQILDSNKLDVNLRRINSQPDRTMRVVLSPGASKETSDILLKADKDKSPHHFSVGANNRGTKETGKNRWNIGYLNTNLLGKDDHLSIRGSMNPGMDVYSTSVSYDIPVSRYNTRVGAYAAYSEADIGGQFAVLSPEGVGTLWGLYVSQPWLDKKFFDEYTTSTLALTSNLTAGFDSISVHNKLLGNTTSQDELRVLKAGINFEEIDSIGRGSLTAEVQAGIPEFLGSMDQYDVSASRIDAGGEFQKYVGSLTRITPLPGALTFVNVLKGQASSYNLVSSEQMIFGGADSVRGYPEADYLADYGWMTTMELRAPFFLLPRELKVPGDKKHTALADAMQMLVFVDGGEGFINRPRGGETGQKRLTSMGFGLRYTFYERLNGRVDVGFPMGDKPSDGSKQTIHFGLEYNW